MTTASSSRRIAVRFAPDRAAFEAGVESSAVKIDFSPRNLTVTRPLGTSAQGRRADIDHAARRRGRLRAAQRADTTACSRWSHPDAPVIRSWRRTGSRTLWPWLLSTGRARSTLGCQRLRGAKQAGSGLDPHETADILDPQDIVYQSPLTGMQTRSRPLPMAEATCSASQGREDTRAVMVPQDLASLDAATTCTKRARGGSSSG